MIWARMKNHRISKGKDFDNITKRSWEWGVGSGDRRIKAKGMRSRRLGSGELNMLKGEIVVG